MITGPIQIVAEGSTNGNGFTTSPVDFTGSNFLVAVTVAAVGALGSFSDNNGAGGNSWSTTTIRATSSCEVRILYVRNAFVSATHTFTQAGSGNSPAMVVYGFNGVKISGGFQGEQGDHNEAVTLIQPGTVLPTEDNCVVISGVVFDATSTVGIGEGYGENVVAYAVGQHFGCAGAYKIQTVAANTNPQTDFGSTVNTAATLVAFNAEPVENWSWHQGVYIRRSRDGG